ncbi:MAG: cupin domain-containing protein [Leptolyngbyaceae cyanobacterium]
MENLFTALPTNLESEVFEDLVSSDSIRIERIISKGHTSPADEWFDQDENEWVMILQGAGTILFDDGNEIGLRVGDYLNIPAHKRHRVIWTEPNDITIWLAVFYK